MRGLIDSLAEASTHERLTAMPHTCPDGWEQVKVKKGLKSLYTCRPPSALSLAKRGADPSKMAWEAIQAGAWKKAADALSLALQNPKARSDRKLKQEIHDLQALVDDEMDGTGLGKRAIVRTAKSIFQKLGLEV